jgi:hypothetical protein
VWIPSHPYGFLAASSHFTESFYYDFIHFGDKTSSPVTAESSCEFKCQKELKYGALSLIEPKKEISRATKEKLISS